MRVNSQSSYHSPESVERQFGVGVLAEHFVLRSLTFPSKNIPITTASPSTFKNIYIFKIQNFENFLLPFFGLWGSCPYFRTSYGLPQVLPYLSLQRHPYATLKKYPRKVESPRRSISTPLLLWCIRPKALTLQNIIGYR